MFLVVFQIEAGHSPFPYGIFKEKIITERSANKTENSSPPG